MPAKVDMVNMMIGNFLLSKSSLEAHAQNFLCSILEFEGILEYFTSSLVYSEALVLSVFSTDHTQY